MTGQDDGSATERSVRLSVDAVIRPATARDMPALATWSGQVDTTFRPVLHSDDRVVLVALANGRFPIGHVLVDLKGTISHLLVLGGFRGQGLGTGLIEAAERRLSERGATHVSLEVEKVNEDAIRLYVRLGYERAGESTATWSEPMPDGTMQPVDHPSWLMRKSLRPP